MNVSLSAQAQDFIATQIDQGLFSSVDRVLEASILALQQQSLVDQFAFDYALENKKQIDGLIEIGLTAANDGQTMSSEDCFNRIRKNLIAKHS